MSVSVNDLLKLPSLRQAKVVAGKNVLHKRVTSISVLESANPSLLVDNVFEQGEYFGSEIAITGFLDCTDDIDLQCASIRRLSEGGEIGLIIFYVGVYLPRIDKKLIDLANSLDFVLIQMPKSKDLRYAEVISDVTECLHRERDRTDYLVSDILARMSTLPLHQRTINSSLRMISDSIMASVLLTDESGHLLNQACWPLSIEHDIKTNLSQILAVANAGPSPGGLFQDTYVFSFDVTPDTGIPMKLIIAKQGEALGPDVLEQICDVTRICANIWGQGYNNIAIKELIRAILQDDPLKMNRLAEIFHINIAQIHEMWILSGDSKESVDIIRKHSDTLRSYLSSCCHTVFSDVYEDCFLLFSSTSSSYQEASEAANAMVRLLHRYDDTITLSKCSNLKNTTEVRSAWLSHENYLSDAKRIFPGEICFTSGQIAFAGECRRIIDQGEDRIVQTTSVLYCSEKNSYEQIDEETLSTYMLDADFSISKTADLLHVHQNTVKYRLKCIDNKLGFHHDQMPDSMRIYYALALHRLLNN